MTDPAPLPPQDLTAEVAVLGAAMIDPRALGELAAVLTPEHFYRLAHGRLWEVIAGMADAGKQVDAMTVHAELERLQVLHHVGGGRFLHDCISSVPTAANALYYADTIRARYARRQLVETGTRLTQLGYQGTDDQDVPALLDRARTDLDKAMPTGPGDGEDEVTFESAFDDVLEAFDSPVPAGLSTGLTDLDRRLGGGMRPGTVFVVGARPGGGKSILGLGVALAAASDGVGALMASMEMTAPEIMERAVAKECRVRYTAIRSRQLDTDDWRRIHLAYERVKGYPLRIKQSPSLSVAALRRSARDMARSKTGLGVVVVDYLQLMRPTDARAPREQQVAEMSRGVKLLAMELEVPVVLLSQMNRAGQGMAALRESGAIEQDADQVCLLEDERDDLVPGTLAANFVKNRGGAKGEDLLQYAPGFMSIENLARGPEPAAMPA